MIAGCCFGSGVARISRDPSSVYGLTETKGDMKDK